jgi:hypothetical protein
MSYLLHEAGLNLLVWDDYGRMPLHDACWRGDPNFDMVEVLLRAELRIAFIRDVRGLMPFNYVRREHQSAWRAIFDERKDLFVHSFSCRQDHQSLPVGMRLRCCTFTKNIYITQLCYTTIWWLSKLFTKHSKL